MNYTLERVIFLFILVITTYYNITLGLLVCFVIMVIYFSQVNNNIEEGFTINNNTNDCDVVKIPNVQVMTTTDYTAIIVEPRKHRALEFVLQNFTENLNENWNFIIYHGSDNMKMLKDIISRLSANVQNRITLINLNVRNLNIKQYSTMFFCPTFYDNIPTETFLIFQTDSMILKENRNKINDFLKYDYVGAPWPKSMGRLGKMEVGNGGLSLRKKSKMVELLKYKEKGIENGVCGKYVAEDQFFCGFFVPEVKVYKPTFIKAKEFSVEAVYSEKPFGVHKPWHSHNLKPYEYIKLCEKYPEVKILTQLYK
jgi:hypothetical protein